MLASFYSPSAFKLAYQPAQWTVKAWLFLFDAVRRLLVLCRAGHFEAVVVYREAFPFGSALLERWIAGFDLPIVYDFDDAVYLANVSQANRIVAWLKRPKKTASIIALSREVMAGNSFLARYARLYSKRVSVLPTVVDTDYLTPGRSEARKTLVIGWIGSPTTESHFNLAIPALRQVQQRYPNVIIRMVGSNSIRTSPDVETRIWSHHAELEELRQFDIGIMPLPNDEWSQGKCGLKALQYMSVGKPVVCSPTEANCEIVQHGRTGFLVRSEQEWFEVLSLLIEDESLRCRMGQAGRARVEEHYSLRRWSPEFVRTILRCKA